MAAKQVHVLQASQQQAGTQSNQSSPHLEGRPLYPIMHRSLSSTPPSVLARWCTTALRGNAVTCRRQEAVASATNRCSQAVCVPQCPCGLANALSLSAALAVIRVQIQATFSVDTDGSVIQEGVWGQHSQLLTKQLAGGQLLAQLPPYQDNDVAHCAQPASTLRSPPCA